MTPKSLSLASIDTLFFDWDGTLLDSERLGYAAFEKTFRELEIAFSIEDYESLYSPNWYTMYEALGLPRTRWQIADDLWIHHYGEELPKLVTGGMETLRKLERKGYRMGIVSSGTRSRVVREIDALQLTAAFRVVVCNEDMVNKKPHPEGLEKAMLQLSCPKQSCSYIGDSPEDILMGKSADVLTVGIRSAYPTHARLRHTNPDIYLESITELLLHF